MTRELESWMLDAWMYGSRIAGREDSTLDENLKALDE